MNAGKYNHKIQIFAVEVVKDVAGFQRKQETLVYETYANVKTTRGATIIRNNSDFERAYTNFTIRFPKVEINRDMLIHFQNKTYSIEYLNNVDEKGVELEMQAREITH